MIKISSITIARNEQNNISRLINSLQGCVDEIIILIDDSSTDKTEEIVKSFPEVKYEVVHWKGYAATKQYAVSLASNDWIFWIDADEAVTIELKEELLKLKLSPPVYSAYSVPRKAYFLNKWMKHSGWYPGRVVRLFDRQKAKFNENEVHEGLIIEGSSGELKGDLDHFTDPDIFHYFEKLNKYTSLAALDLSKKNKNVSLKDILLRPIAIFIKMYFIKRGFLDGIQGFLLAVFSSAYVFTKYTKFWELKKKAQL